MQVPSLLPLNRRRFLYTAAGAASAFTFRGLVKAAEFDLVIKGGRVIDPARRIDEKLDVAIQGSKIAAVRKDIPVASASEVATPRRPWLVTRQAGDKSRTGGRVAEL